MVSERDLRKNVNCESLCFGSPHAACTPRVSPLFWSSSVTYLSWVFCRAPTLLTPFWCDGGWKGYRDCPESKTRALCTAYENNSNTIYNVLIPYIDHYVKTCSSQVISNMSFYMCALFSYLVLFLQVKAELKMENQRLKDENGALIRVITKLSKWDRKQEGWEEEGRDTRSRIYTRVLPTFILSSERMYVHSFPVILETWLRFF